VTFRVQLTNPAGWRLTLIVPGDNYCHACEVAEARANADPEHVRHGPWTSGFSTRAS
jgi:hypothetical protein